MWTLNRCTMWRVHRRAGKIICNVYFTGGWTLQCLQGCSALSSNSFVDKVIIWTNSFHFINCCMHGEVKGILYGMQKQPGQPFLINHLIGVLAWVLKPLAECATVDSGTVCVPIVMYSWHLLQGRGTPFTKVICFSLWVSKQNIFDYTRFLSHFLYERVFQITELIFFHPSRDNWQLFIKINV